MVKEIKNVDRVDFKFDIDFWIKMLVELLIYKIVWFISLGESVVL